MPPGLIAEEGAWGDDEIHGELSTETDESSQASQAANASQNSEVSSTTANYQAMRNMFGDSEIPSRTGGSSTLTADNVVADAVQSQATAPASENAESTISERRLLATALDALTRYEPPCITTSDANNIILAQQTPATCPKALVPQEDLAFLVGDIERVHPRLRKLFNAVVEGLRALTNIQEEAEKLKVGHFGSEEEERLEALQKWQHGIGKMETLLMDVEEGDWVRLS